MVKALRFTVLAVVATFTLEAPELERTMLPDLAPAVAVAARRR